MGGSVGGCVGGRVNEQGVNCPGSRTWHGRAQEGGAASAERGRTVDAGKRGQQPVGQVLRLVQHGRVARQVVRRQQAAQQADDDLRWARVAAAATVAWAAGPPLGPSAAATEAAPNQAPRHTHTPAPPTHLEERRSGVVLKREVGRHPRARPAEESEHTQERRRRP